MRTCWVQSIRIGPMVLSAVLATATLPPPILAQDSKPTGAPLALSSIETEQEIPLAIILADGKTAKCVTIRLHWISKPDVGPNEDAASFTLDLPPDNPAAPIFMAQLWNASLASALAWQEPWEGARWKVLQTPVTDGTGLDAAMAVGMIATSARRPYPPKTVVIGHLNPDGSLGPVSHLLDRINAAASAGMTRVIIPGVQRFDTDSTGQVINVVRHATDQNLECVPVDDLVTATQTTMNDPLPDTTLNSSIPTYSNDVASYIDTFAHHEQNEVYAGLKFAPKETELSTYPPRLAAIWKGVYADYDAGQQAYRAGQVYTAYRLFSRANGQMNGANALAGQTQASFDVKSALAESDDLHNQLHTLMNPPAIDQGGLESAVLVAEMADWAYGINASLEGAQLVTKQAFSKRSDATDAEKDRARESILFANEQCKYLLTQADFYTGLLTHLSKENPGTAEENAAHLLPQLIPAQLATARSFTDGIRASDLRDGLLFDPRLVAYVNVLRQTKADWDARQRKRDIESQTTTSAATPAAAAPANNGPMKLNANAPESAVGFDPGDTYKPPHTIVASSEGSKKLSDTALCLIWANHDCEIATLDEKYLRLSGTMDPNTHEWRVKDRGRLDALLQMAEIGARHGIAFAGKAEIDPAVLAMIYERAGQERLQGDDASALDALRNYWRCALLGNVCWQLAHTPKAQPVDLSTLNLDKDGKPIQKDEKKTDNVAKDENKTGNDGDKVEVVAPAASTNVVVVVPSSNTPVTTNEVVTPISPPATTNSVAPEPPPEPPAAAVAVAPANSPAQTVVAAQDPPVTPAFDESKIPVAPIATNMDNPAPPPSPAPVNNDSNTPAPNPTPADNGSTGSPPPSAPVPAPAPAAAASNDTNEMNIPVAPIAKAQDYAAGESTPATNAAPVVAPVAPAANKSNNADGRGGGF